MRDAPPKPLPAFQTLNESGKVFGDILIPFIGIGSLSAFFVAKFLGHIAGLVSFRAPLTSVGKLIEENRRSFVL
jgi:hypothetical protein